MNDERRKALGDYFDDLLIEGQFLWSGDMTLVPIQKLNVVPRDVCPVCGSATEDGCRVVGPLERGDPGGIVVCKNAWLYAAAGLIRDIRPLIKDNGGSV